jgi:glycolate oxidase iron-sulfur subunit
LAASKDGNWPLPADAPEDADLSRCVHCGLCLNSCPTYLVTGLEAESPRGRIYLARAVDRGDLPLTETVQAHWDLCLQCRACEAVCPSSVPYGRIMEHARAQVDAAPPSQRGQRRLRKLLLRQVIARPAVLRLAMLPARVAAQKPVRRIIRGSRILRLVAPLDRLEAQLPELVGKPFRAGDELPQPAVSTGTAVLFVGCVMGELFGRVHRATGRLLARRGIGCTAPEEQGCCGALHAHDGDLAFARRLARRTIDGLEATAPATIVVNSAGCGAAMKEYGDLLVGDPDYAERARAFSARVRDLSEVLADLPPVPARFEGSATYQHPCHLAHAQRIRTQPAALMAQVEACVQVDTAGSDICCGAAGIYSLVQPEMSAQLRGRKASEFAEHRPDVVVTANPGCQLQYEAAVREAGVASRVMHLAEFLDEAERRAARD